MTEVDSMPAAAARLPFLVSWELAQSCCPSLDRWNLHGPPDGTTVSPAGLFEAAQRQGRILVSRNVAFLDDALFPPEQSHGVIVLGRTRGSELTDALVTLVGLLGPDPVQFRGVKAGWTAAEVLTLSAPDGPHRRATRRFGLDHLGVPQLRGVELVIMPDEGT
jgi:hypothetical protein